MREDCNYKKSAVSGRRAQFPGPQAWYHPSLLERIAEAIRARVRNYSRLWETISKNRKPRMMPSMPCARL
jgi:hypothetical protein